MLLNKNHCYFNTYKELTSPLKTGAIKSREFGLELLILKGKKSDEKLKAHRSTDRLCDQTVRDRYPRGIGLQKNGHQRGDILQLEEENAQLKKLVADLSLDKQMLQDVLKKVLKPSHRRTMVTGLISDYQISLRRACEVSLLSTSVWYYKHNRRDDGPLRLRIKIIAETRVRYGIERIVVLLKREGWRDNPKRIYRIYKEEGLNLRVKRPRRRASIRKTHFFQFK